MYHTHMSAIPPTFQETKMATDFKPPLHLYGAYGRKASLDDWLAGKDFKIESGPYCSIRDMEQMQKTNTIYLMVPGKPLKIEEIQP